MNLDQTLQIFMEGRACETIDIRHGTGSET